MDGTDISWLGPRNWDLLEQLFETSAGVSDCWCIWPRVARGRHVPEACRNRERMRSIIESGERPGLLAVTKDRALGWCAFGPRDRYPQYTQDVDADAWAIPCIYIPRSPAERAVARSLIGHALNHARSKNARLVEGPPVWWLPGDVAAIERATGFFLENGFVRLADGQRMPVLRCELQ